MKQNFKTSNIKLLLIPLTIFVIVKILWVFVEFRWLPAIGIDHIENKDIKALYYRVKLAHKNYNKPLKETHVKQVASIKDIELVAIYSSKDYAVITVKYRGKTKVLSTGERINGFKLIRAYMKYVLFEKNGKTYKVELPKSKHTNSYISSRQKKNINKPTNQHSIIKTGHSIKIDKSVFEHFTNNLNDIYKNIAIQDIKDGDRTLFKISFIKKGSVFDKLGIKRGDIIKSVNGEDIDSYSKAFSIYGGIKNMQNLVIVVIRNNKEVELEYEID